MLFICFFQDSGYLLNFQQQSEEKILEQEDCLLLLLFWVCLFVCLLLFHSPLKRVCPCLHFFYLPCKGCGSGATPQLSRRWPAYYNCICFLLFFTLIFYIPLNSRKALSWKHPCLPCGRRNTVPWTHGPMWLENPRGWRWHIFLPLSSCWATTMGQAGFKAPGTASRRPNFHQGGTLTIEQRATSLLQIKWVGVVNWPVFGSIHV